MFWHIKRNLFLFSDSGQKGPIGALLTSFVKLCAGTSMSGSFLCHYGPMKTQKRLSSLTCDQVYNIWNSEPDLISILDLRPKPDFLSHHIPGARNISAELLSEELSSLGQKLAVLVLPEGQQFELDSSLQVNDNFVIMKDCHQWFRKNMPVVGASAQIVNNKWLKELGDKVKSEAIFYQLFEPESSTYTYIIGDNKTKEAAIIDPVISTVDRDLKLIDELGLHLIYVLDTHVHADHITAASEIRKRVKAKTAVSQEAGVGCVDIPLEDGQELLLGDRKITAIATPGHTNTCMSFYFEGMVFTGDALLIRGSGRTDFQQGSAETLYESVHTKLFNLPGETKVYPGHDYRGQTVSTIEMEKKFNPRLGVDKTKSDFVKIMSELKLANPKKIHEAVPANLACGNIQTNRVLNPQVVDGIPEVSCEEVQKTLHRVRLIDVRTPEEFNNELAHIPGAELVPLGPELIEFLQRGDRNQEIVFVCRSGGRSGTATAESVKLGYKYTINMVGGMIRWNELKFTTERT